MHRAPHSRSWSLLVLAGLLLAIGSAGLAGCGESDPLAKVRARQRAGDFSGSLEPLRELLAERPDDAEVNFLYGRALSLTGQFSQAEWSLRKAMEDPKWLVPAGMQLAVGALRSVNYETAIEATDRVLEAEPENLNALMTRANAHASAQSHDDWEQALDDVDRILELDPDNVDILRPRILALISLDRIDEAGEELEKMGERIKEENLGADTEAWHCATMAVFADENGDHELADQRFTECLERFPAHPNLVSNAVQFYDAQGARNRSLEILRKALEEAPNAREYRSGLAQRLRAVGENEEAEKILREATENPQPILALSAWFELAEHYQAVGDFKAGAEAADRAAKIAEEVGISHPQILLEQADALVLAGELDRAQEVAEKITVEAHRELVLARIAQERGNFKEALQRFDRALELWPNNPAARYEAARAAAASGHFDRAVEEFRYAVRLDPTATDARTQLARFYLAEGRPLDALQTLRIRGQVPLSLEGELLAIRLGSQAGGQGPAVQRSIARFHSVPGSSLAKALVAMAEGVGARTGPAGALVVLREAQNFDLTAPGNEEALRALVRFSHEAGKLEEAEATVGEALAAHPENAELHDIQGLVLELRGAPGEEIRAAYNRALELEPENARALAGLAREALPRDPEQALSLFDRAVAADPSDVESKRGAARALVALGRHREAEDRLEALLVKHPYEGSAAAQLARLQLEQGPATEETLSMAQRAVRFGGGAGELDLLSQVYAQRGDAERASRAAEAARRLREELAGAPGTS